MKTTIRQPLTPDTCEVLKRNQHTGKIHLRCWKRKNYPGVAIPKTLIPEVLSAGYWDSKQKLEEGLGWHCNEGIEFGFLESGSLDFSTEKKEFSLHPGQITITRPWQPHRVGRPGIGANRYHWFIIDLGTILPHSDWNWPSWILLYPPLLSRLTSRLRHNEEPVWQGTKSLGEAFTKLSQAIEMNPNPQSATIVALSINAILLELYNCFEERPAIMDYSLTGPARSVEWFLTRRLPLECDQLWTLEMMAEACKMSRSSFSTHCRTLTNLNPINYLTSVRIQKAEEMLRNFPKKSITEIAYDCGFQSSQYFNNVYKKTRKMSPSEFRGK